MKTLLILSTILIMSFSLYGEIFSGTLTVLQKDAYKETAGRTSDLWPPHTTTVLEWGENHRAVQVNHGTSPEERDANGDLFLVPVKVYRFSGTESELQELEATYKLAVNDDADHKFFSLDDGQAAMVESLLNGLYDYIADDENGFICSNGVTKEQVLSMLSNKNFDTLLIAIPKCNWTQTDYNRAFNYVLDDIFATMGEYHVCNDDAIMQVDLVKNFILNGNITMPEKSNDGPDMFYTPTDVEECFSTTDCEGPVDIECIEHKCVQVNCGSSMCNHNFEECINNLCVTKDNGNGNGTINQGGCSYSNNSNTTIFITLFLFVVIFFRRRKEN